MFRADAFATLYLFDPLRKLIPPPGGRVPILMYHSISDRKESRHPYYRTVTTPEVFARHMEYLHENGYSGVGLSDAVACMNAQTLGCARPVGITFDDGFRDFYSEAFPILRKYGFSASVFLATAYIGQYTLPFKSCECLTWREVRELAKAGVEFGSHTVSHPQLHSLAREDVEYEVRASKDAIEQELGSRVTSFAYPFAFPEADKVFALDLSEMLQEAGYENGVSTIIGIADQKCAPFFLKRLPMNSCDDLPLLRAKLEGGYNWLHSIQYSAKAMITRFSRGA